MIAGMSAVRVSLCLSLSVLACSDDGATTTPGSSSGEASSSSSSSGAVVPTTGGETSSGEPGTSSSGETGFEPPTPACGNGYLEADEECDDGNLADGDDCNAACLVPCGLELAVTELAPTAQSVIGGLTVATAPDGGFVTVARLREIIVDQEQNSMVGPREILVLAYDADGALRWRREVSDMMGDLYAAGGSVDDSGDVLLIGSVDGPDASAIWVGKLDGSDGGTLWTRAIDGEFPLGDDFGSSVVATATGDVIAAGQIRSAMNDADVWVGKLAAGDGELLWTTTWTGVEKDGYSVDAAGPLALGPDGSIHVVAREFVNLDTSEATLLKFPADGGKPQWSASPLADGGEHKHNYRGLAVGPDGEIMMGVVRDGAAATFWIFRFGPDGGAPTWSRTRDDFVTLGADWFLSGLGIDPGGNIVVGGSWLDDASQADAEWFEVWSARLDKDGEKRCQVSARAPGEGLVPPSVTAADVRAGADGVVLAAGELIEGTESSVWTGRFRPL